MILLNLSINAFVSNFLTVFGYCLHQKPLSWFPPTLRITTSVENNLCNLGNNPLFAILFFIINIKITNLYFLGYHLHPFVWVSNWFPEYPPW
jgi:hypothetical protein